MNRLILLLVCTICCTNTKAQNNLVYNGDFERRDSCPDNFSQMHYVDGWRRYTLGSSDYFSTCKPTAPLSGPMAPGNAFGYQEPLSGECYTGGYSFYVMGGFFTTSTEYIAGRLIEPLKIGTAYEVSFSTSLADLCHAGHNSLGVYFYKDAPDTIYAAETLVSLIPQITFLDSGCIIDTANWVRMVSEFVADSAYKNLVIGQFKIGNNFQYAFAGKKQVGASYYYYDSVFVRVARLNNLFNDSTLCIGQSFDVPYSLVPGTKIYSGNVFTAELSDSSGSFASSTTLVGTLSDTTDGVIKCVIPATVIPGTKYRIRVVSSKPIRISNDNGKDIRIDRSPDIALTSSTTICEGDSLKLSADEGVGNVTYYWEGPNGFTSNQNSYTIAGVSMAAGGKYIVTTKYYGCTAYDTATVVVKHRPVMPKLESNSPLSVGDILKLNVTNPEPDVEYIWNGPLKFNSTSVSPEIKGITFDHAGVYKILASQNGCTNSSLITVYVGDASTTTYVLYPNPNNGDFTFSATTKTDQYISLWIYNSNGQLVFKDRQLTLGKKLKLNIKLHDALSSGIYTLRVNIDGKNYAVKFTVNRGHQ